MSSLATSVGLCRMFLFFFYNVSVRVSAMNDVLCGIFIALKIIIIIIIIIIITTTIFIVLSSWQSHCESSLGSHDEYRNGARWPPTFGPSQSAGTAGPPIGRQ